jgi:hypothetical protein
MPGAVVEDEAANEGCLRVHLVLHLHDLNHVEVDWLREGIDASRALGRRRGLNEEHGVNDRGRELGRELGVEFGRERCVGDRDEGRTVKGRGLLEGVQELG